MPKAVKNQFGLAERDFKTIENIFNKYSEIREVFIFGSRATNKHKQGSDIDLAVINEGVPPQTIKALAAEFEESSLPYKVDLAYLPDLNQNDLAAQIHRIGILIYKK